MNRLFVIFILAILASCAPKEEKTIITGKVDNPVTKSFEITYTKDIITTLQEKHVIVLDENNSFHLELDINKPLMAQLAIKGEEEISLYIKPGDALHVSADVESFNSTLRFTGDNAESSAFLFKYQNKLDNKYKQQQVNSKIRTLDPVEFVEFIEEMLNARQELYNDISESKSISDDLKNYLETDILYEYYSYRLIYPMSIITKDKWEKLPEDYFDFLDEASSKMANNKLVSPNYRSFINQYLEYYKSENPGEVPESLSPVKANIYLAEKLLEGKTLQYIKAVNIYNEFFLGSFERAEKLYKSFMEEEPCKGIANILKATYDKFKRTLPGNPAPDFELTDINGEVVSLSDFRGKVVYLDFWASWCPPCMREVPYAKELKERFKDEDDLVFLYISIDEDTDAWRRTVKEREIEGVHLNVFGRNHVVPKSYNVRWIPTYYIIDRDGVIFKNHAKRPSTESIDDDLGAALDLVS